MARGPKYIRTDERSRLIALYRAAFEAANGHAISVTYRNGWFTIGTTDGAHSKRVRRDELVSLTSNLRARHLMRLRPAVPATPSGKVVTEDGKEALQ